MQESLDAGRKLHVHGTFRRRFGIILKILSTFNLRLVSREELQKMWSYEKNYFNKATLSSGPRCNATTVSLCIAENCLLLTQGNMEKDTYDFRLTLIFPGLPSSVNKLVMYPPRTVVHCNTIHALDKL